MLNVKKLFLQVKDDITIEGLEIKTNIQQGSNYALLTINHIMKIIGYYDTNEKQGIADCYNDLCILFKLNYNFGMNY